MKKNVLLVDPTIQKVGVEILEKSCNVFIAPNGNEDILIEYLNKYEIDAIIPRIEKISRKVIKSSKTLRVIGQPGVGLDHIDIIAAKEKGIKVLNVPDGNYISVAEHTLMFILALSRNLLAADKNVRIGNWGYRETNMPIEVYEKNLFILGFGRIGREVARKASAFDMKIYAYDPYIVKDDMERLGVKKIEGIKEGICFADFTSIHMPLTEETKSLISINELNCMKPNSYIINMSRGGILDEDALTKALESNKITGAGLDVFEKEPFIHPSSLKNMEKVIFTPHLGGNAIEAKDRNATIIVSTVLEALEGKATYNIVKI